MPDLESQIEPVSGHDKNLILWIAIGLPSVLAWLFFILGGLLEAEATADNLLNTWTLRFVLWYFGILIWGAALWLVLFFRPNRR